MERLIDISKFLIIKQTHFEELISQIGVNLTVNDTSYLLTYLFANLFAYIIIFLFLTLIIKVGKLLFRKRRLFYRC